MKKLHLLIIALISFTSVNGQNVPIDFETGGNGADWSWKTFENDSDPALEIVDNPHKTGINTSSKVAKFTALQKGNPWAGCESLHGSDIGTFSITRDNSIIRIMVWKTEKSDVGIKLVRADNWSLGELKVANTMVNEWEQLEFDFSAHVGNTYDQIVVFPDFNARGQDNVIYFDNVYGPKAPSLAIEDIANNGISLYPNPTQSSLTIKSNSIIEHCKVFTIQGILVAEYQIDDQQTTIDLSSLKNAVYVLETFSEGNTSVSRFVKN